MQGTSYLFPLANFLGQSPVNYAHMYVHTYRTGTYMTCEEHVDDL